MVFSDVHLIDVEGHFLGRERFGNSKVLPIPALFTRLLIECPLVRAPSVLIRSSCYKKLGLYETNIRCIIDWEMWLRVSLNYDVAHIPEPLALYRIHLGSDSINRKLTEIEDEQQYVATKITNLFNQSQNRNLKTLKNVSKLISAYNKIRMARKYYQLGNGKQVRVDINQALKIFPSYMVKNALIIIFLYITSFLGKGFMKIITSVKNSLFRRIVL